MADAMTLTPIGRVLSPFQSSASVPLEGSRCTIEVDDRYAEALDGLAHSSHVAVLGFLHLADRSVLRARPRKLDASAPPRGVFASRSPARPNPISLTVVPLVALEGRRLTVDHLDLVDGTPIVDLKPYSPGWDNVFCAHHAHRAAPHELSDPLLAAILQRDLANFMGAHLQSPEGRWGLAAVFVAARLLGVDPRDRDLRVQVHRIDARAEVIMGLTGAALFNRRMSIGPTGAEGTVQFRCLDRAVHLRAHGACPGFGDYRNWPAAFAIQHFAAQDDPRWPAGLAKIQADRSEGGL